MMSNNFLSGTILLALLTSAQVSANETFPKLKGLWFGQKTPSSTPELFAPGLVSQQGRYEYGMSFSPALDEFYFTSLHKGDESNPEIYYSKIENGYWSKPQKADFSKGKLVYELLPHVSLNGDKIYFTGRTTPSKDTSGIWYVTLEKNGWSDIKRLNVKTEIGRLSDYNQGKKGEAIFTNMPERTSYTATNTDGQFSLAKPLNIEFGLHGFISPEQDYLLVNGRNPNAPEKRDSDLFVHFKHSDGSWSKAINLGSDINTSYSETVARVTPDGKYLFFGRYNEPDRLSNIYWVSTDVIYQLKKAYFHR